MSENFYGLPTGALENRFLRLEYLTQAGPRLVRLIWLESGENLFAEVPLISWETPGGTYYPRGGHRLWVAPESRARTYTPDNTGLLLAATPDGIRLEQPSEAAQGIGKSIEIHLPPDRPALTVRHTIHNSTPETLTIAPWAITQLQPGGTALLPYPSGPLDPDGLLPNRNLVFWPYTLLSDSRLHIEPERLLVKADTVEAPLKIGYLNPIGWAGYRWRDLFFIKRFPSGPALPYPDLNCNVEVYTNHQFLELETLGPLRSLKPGESLRHTEEWEVHPFPRETPIEEITDWASSANQAAS